MMINPLSSAFSCAPTNFHKLEERTDPHEKRRTLLRQAVCAEGIVEACCLRVLALYTARAGAASMLRVLALHACCACWRCILRCWPCLLRVLARSLSARSLAVCTLAFCTLARSLRARSLSALAFTECTRTRWLCAHTVAAHGGCLHALSARAVCASGESVLHKFCGKNMRSLSVRPKFTAKVCSQSVRPKRALSKHSAIACS
eukprot:2615301-Pleurochrysis_carterae.AAC.2